MNYILLKKIFSAKDLITTSTDLTKKAHQYNFTDLAHFSKTFKRGGQPQDLQYNYYLKSIKHAKVVVRFIVTKI